VIRLGTRASALALVQAREVASRLEACGERVELVPMRTEGDRLFGVALASVGGKGLFVREIEEALLAGAIDVAVHSLKDLPADVPADLCLAAFPRREDPRDVLVTRDGESLESLARGAVVGTSSPRRRALVRAARADLAVEPLRGNVDTRLRKLQEKACDALVLAAAGLHRLGVTPPHAQPLSPETFVPAVGQGTLGVETRRADQRTRALVAALDDPPTRARALAERAVLRRLGGSCASALAAHARVGDDGRALEVVALVASEDGREIVRGRDTGTVEDPEAVGRRLGEWLLDRGAETVAALDPGRWSASGG
jgi:hydroxymethylbilane synthase